MSVFQIFIIIILLFCSLASSQPTIPTNTTVICPLDFSIGRLVEGSRPFNEVTDQCLFIIQGFRLVQSDYLHRTNSFLPPPSSSDSCWKDYQNIFNQFPNSFDIQTTYGFQTQWMAQGCKNITTISQYEDRNSNATLNGALEACNQSLHATPCATCNTTLSALLPSDVKGKTVGNVSDYSEFKSIYAAAFANYSFGPTDRDTAKCLFSLNVDSSKSNKKHSIALIFVFSWLVLLVLGG